MSLRGRLRLGVSLLLLAVTTGTLIAPWLQERAVAPAPAGSALSLERAAEQDGVVYGPWYELAFTQVPGVRCPAPETRHQAPCGSPVETLLVGLIDRAGRTVDVAIHDIDLESVAQAMARASSRGVRVRVVAESDTLANIREPSVQAALGILRDAGISVVGDGRRQSMHHKFSVADGQWVQTGSWNYTASETYRNHNHAIVIESRELAANFTAEFEKMFSRGQFGPAKPRGAPHPVLSLGGSRVESYFSPQDRAASHLIRWIGSARQRIHFLAFAFTHDGIADAMLERARAGVQVAGVFEASDSASPFSEYARMREAGLEVLRDANPWAMHHKVILIDDRVSIFGSFNFSANADRENDENLLIVEDPGLTAAFEAEYRRIRREALRSAEYRVLSAEVGAALRRAEWGGWNVSPSSLAGEGWGGG